MQPCDNHFKPIFILTHDQILSVIKEMLAENVYLIKQNPDSFSHNDGRSCALKELCVELGIATYEELLD